MSLLYSFFHLYFIHLLFFFFYFFFFYSFHLNRHLGFAQALGQAKASGGCDENPPVWCLWQRYVAGIWCDRCWSWCWSHLEGTIVGWFYYELMEYFTLWDQAALIMLMIWLKFMPGFVLMQQALRRKEKISPLGERSFKKDCLQIVSNITAKILEKSPLKYSVVQYLSSLDPSKMAHDPATCKALFRSLVQKLLQCKQLKGGVATGRWKNIH